jgi:glyoxylase-like metal-dependent hydrolase (beta-lactamase superfamily II)
MRHLNEGRNTIYQGAKIDFKILPIARIDARDFLVRKGGSLKKRRLAAYAYLVRHPVHGNILIDLGYPEVTAEDPAEYPGFPAYVLMKIHMKKEDHVAEKIGRLGLRPEDIDLVLFTHLHIDHMGDIRCFPSSRILVHQKEWEEALEKGRSHGFRPDYLQGLSPEFFSFPENSPCGPFDRSLDILGDGSIVAVPTPGHTGGHVSYFIHTGDRSFFLTGDAAWVKENYELPVRKGWLAHTFVEADKAAQKDSLARIHRLSQDRKDLWIVPGHDGAVLTDETLKPYLLE